MARLKFLSAAALLAAAVTTPAFAQPVIQEPGAAAQNRPWVNDYDRYDAHPGSGFGSGDVATGAADTAGAIAPAPLPGPKLSPPPPPPPPFPPPTTPPPPYSTTPPSPPP